jgi:hypothetical protein
VKGVAVVNPKIYKFIFLIIIIIIIIIIKKFAFLESLQSLKLVRNLTSTRKQKKNPKL